MFIKFHELLNPRYSNFGKFIIHELITAIQQAIHIITVKSYCLRGGPRLVEIS